MAHVVPTPKWEMAPCDVRTAWHNLNNTTMGLLVLQKQAKDLIGETAQLLEGATQEGVEKQPH